MQADESKVKALESIFGGQDITASVIRTVLSTNENKFDDAVDSLLNMTNNNTNNDNNNDKPRNTAAPQEPAPQEDAQKEKLKTLENMFGADLSQSVICTVLQSNKGELVDAVDTLLNMTSKDINPYYANDTKQQDSERARQEEELKSYEDFKRLQINLQEEEARVVREQQQKMERELAEAAAVAAKAELERKEKVLQATLSQERALREIQAKRQAELETQRQKESAEREAVRMAEMEAKRQRLAELKATAQMQAELEASKQAELSAREAARLTEEAKLQAEQERLRLAFEDKLKVLATEEENVRIREAKQKAEEDARRQELSAREEALRAQEEERRKQLAALKQQEEANRLEILAKEEALKAHEERLQRVRLEEERRIAQLRDQLEETERAKTEELARMRKEAQQREEERRRAEQQQREQLEQQLRIEAEARAHKQRMEEEERVRKMKFEEEARAAQKQRFEEEKLELQRERAKLEAFRVAQEEKLRAEASEKQRAEELRRLALEAEAKQRKLEEEARAEALRQREAELARRIEEERLFREEQHRIELEKIRQQEEEVRRIEEEKRNQALQEEAERQQLAFEEERRKKLAYDQIAASAIFIPPKAEASAEQISIKATAVGDVVTVEWDLPEGNATATNWLGLYPVRALPNTNKYVQFVYTNGAHTGQHVFRGVTPGHYEARFFATRAYQHTAVSSTIRVGPTPTLSAQLQGEQLLVHYTLDPISSSPTREWLGIYEKGQRRNKLYLSSAYGNAEGQIMMKAPRNPGTYEIRLFASGAVYNEQAKCEFTVEDNDCINIAAGSVSAGQPVGVTWVIRTLEPSSYDWVGLYRADETNNSNYLSCTYTQGASVGSAEVAAPKEAGVYELRLFVRAKGRYTTFRTSQALTVV